MPTFLAMIVASTGSYLFHKLQLPMILQFLLDMVVWLVLFIWIKRLLTDLKPK